MLMVCYSSNMAAPVNKRSCWSPPEVYKHHEQRKVCISRPKYREGRRSKAVKVYTINLESRYLMVQGVPAIGVMTELVQLCALYGAVEEYRPLDEYPAEQFTEVYLVKFQKLTSARAAKRQMDEKSFYGGILHVCYVPEHETVEDTRLKLQDRRRYVTRTAQNKAREKEQREEGTEEGTKEPMRPVTASKRAPWRAEPASERAPWRAEPVPERAPWRAEPVPERAPWRAEPVPERAPWRAEPVPGDSSAGEPSSIGRYSDFPLLPLPPREDHHYRHNATQRTMPTEDKMGTLHSAIVMDTKQQPAAQSSSSGQQASSNGEGGTGSGAVALQAPAVPRFVPRTAHLEIRKRRLETTEKDHSVIGVSGEDEPLIGPKLPEPPKTDMEDESLNTTANRIRNAMKKVAAIPDVKPVEKKTKPRRRI